VSALRVLILDFDGVVIESNDVKKEAFQRVFARFPEHAEAMMAFHHAHVSLSRFAKGSMTTRLWMTLPLTFPGGSSRG
jgi:beta-phosphoglucomutase-like phosphatase (HAD superfamily)